MSIIVYVLVSLLIINAGILTLLILAQPPKKDAGGGLAFGGGTADALFGAGSGNALTKITKWATCVFIVLAVILGMIETRMHHGNQSEFESGVEQQQQMQGSPQPRVAPQPGSTPPPASPAAAPSAMPLYSATNAAPSPAPTGK